MRKLQEPIRYKGVDQDGKPISLEDFRGRWLALYFYPKDDTPGCTQQACNLRENYDELQKLGVEIVGVSLDTVESHKKFESKYRLPFRLIADHDRSLSKQLGVYKWRLGFSFLPYRWIKRTTILIDPRGEEVGRIENVDTANHAKQILDYLRPHLS
ncbi:MAG: peroxiredoxin [Chlamydiia bacterium]